MTRLWISTFRILNSIKFDFSLCSYVWVISLEEHPEVCLHCPDYAYTVWPTVLQLEQTCSDSLTSPHRPLLFSQQPVRHSLLPKFRSALWKPIIPRSRTILQRWGMKGLIRACWKYSAPSGSSPSAAALLNQPLSPQPGTALGCDWHVNYSVRWW